LRVSLFLKDINTLINSLKRNILFSALIIALISLLGALIFSRSLSKPISELNAAAHKVATGDFNVRVFLKNRDEIKELGDSFNYMVEKIRELFTELSLKKEQLNSIISSIQEGLLVFDKTGKIILSNDSFKKIINESDIEDKYYWEAIRVPQFSDLIKKVTEGERNYVAEELPLKDKFFICSVTFLESREETVVILSDITQMKNVEKIKKDFVVNVSHELRTPLTAIKGFVETLEESVEDENRNYVEIIKRNTDRLINIVEDLLVLSELEEKGTTLELEDLQLKEMIERILKIFEPRMKEKGLNLELHVEDTAPRIMADAFKLEQALINLIDNAVKYTEQGTIAISLKYLDSRVMIEIKDTGIGIPEEHIPRLFERFYVVDKSRSKRLGGTGLGLSIVKHIVLLHNGTLQVKSLPSQGTTFSISLPTTPV
jgi:two-component system phosphate regulon sensor histidine kinase PhoR